MVWMARVSRHGGLALVCALGGFFASGAHAQLSVSGSGNPVYSRAIAVPPGIGGMQPNLSLMYAGGGVNGPVGHGWSLQGISMVTRCPATQYTDGLPLGVVFSAADKLCLDGQRLIQTDATGVPAAFPQTDDAKGLDGDAWREYRTEKDSFARVRAYGMTGSSAANGPKYFKVWTKAGQIYEYGSPPSADANTQATILAQGKTVAMVWAVARIGDVVGNTIDFKYENREKDWGSHAYKVAGSGREWNIREIQYTGNGTQLPANKVVFRYSDRVADAAESYQQGSKNVSVRRLDAIDTYVNAASTALAEEGKAPAGGLLVKRIRIDYSQGGLTGRSRVASISECVDQAGTRCLPPSRFSYATGGTARKASINFNLGSDKLSTMDGKYGVMAGDFNGDGRTDLIRWSENPTETLLLQSNGDGSFVSVTTSLTAMGALNRADGCVSSTVADANGDGLPDIIRVFNDKNSGGESCGQTARAEFLINQGGGVFDTKALMDTGNVAIAFKRQVAMPTSKQYCGQVAAASNDAGSRDLVLALAGQCTGSSVTGYGWTSGATYYFMDVNGDGRLDVITTTLAPRPALDPRDSPYADEDYPTCTACTKVYLAQADGRFAPVTTNVDNIPLYSDPGRFGSLNSWTFVRDINGDGLADLLSAGAPRKYRHWTSDGRGNFTPQPSWGDEACNVSLDFNGDGRADCLKPGTGGVSNSLHAAYASTGTLTVDNFSLASPSVQLSSNGANTIGQNYGVYAIDVNGDGRDDLIRWHDDPTQNKLYLSNGDGSFGEAPMSALGEMSSMILGQSDSTYDLLIGDFRGLGSAEFLRISRNAVDITDLAKKNKLFVTVETDTPDRLTSFVSPTGLMTRISYEPMAGGRVLRDAGTDNRARYPLTDVMPPGQIVAVLEQETGVGAETVKTQYGYTGMKAAVDGRGMLGFRRTVQQNEAPNGDPLSVWTDFLLEEPYAGVAKRTQTRLGSWTAADAQLLSQTENIYCDRTSATNPDLADVDAPCATSAKVTRPYLRKSIESGKDLTGKALPVVTTVNSYNDYGDPTQIVVTTTGEVANAGVQTSTKTTTNTYCMPGAAGCANKIDGDNWILGRLSRATVTSSVPNLIETLEASAGSSRTAKAISGDQKVSPPPSMSPAVLSAILQILLDD